VNDPEIGATGNVVYHLVKGLENQGFTVYMDRLSSNFSVTAVLLHVALV